MMRGKFQINSKKTLFASCFLSNFLEFYDFALFGAFLVPMSKDFFIDDELSGILRSLMIFGVAFFARPFGSLFFGYLGDTRGRKTALMSSILVMGIFTCLIGCIPSATQIGILAPILLILCRLAQGFALGGESNGSFIFLLENLNKRKGLAGSIVLACGTVGFIAATFMGIMFTRYDVPHWYWRIPFCMGIIVGIAGMLIRSFLYESEIFLQCEKHGSIKQLFSELSKRRQSFLRVIGISGVNSTFVYILSSYISIYLHQFEHLTLSDALFYTQSGLIFCLVTVPLFGYLSDITSHQGIMKLGCYLGIVFSFCIPWFLYSGYYMPAVMFLAILIGIFNGPTPAFINTLFPPNVRYSGISISFSIGSACFGGIAPLVCSYLTHHLKTVFAVTPCLFLISVIGYLSVRTQTSFSNQSNALFKNPEPQPLPQVR